MAALRGHKREGVERMAYATLIIDYEELNDVKEGLAFVHQELSNVKHIVGQIQSMIGKPEPDLDDAISRFESSWDDNRKALVETTKSMGEAVTGVLDDWNSWDSGTAASIEGSAPEQRSVNGPV
jgi:hypothetical protein